MSAKGTTWTDEYRERYYSSPKVQSHLEKFKVVVSQPKSEEQKKKMSLAKLGKPLSEEHKKALSIAQRTRLQLKKTEDVHKETETSNQ